MNKKAENLIIGNITYLLFVLIVVVGLFFFVTRAGSQAPLYEQIYAKQISLAINKAKPGMVFEMDIFDIYNIARKNRFGGEIVLIDNVNNLVIVKLVNGEGYRYNFFNDVHVDARIENKGVLILDIKEP
ncbi:hypothetical protein CMI43_02630 [Candidatus Pacearchaeota archaeon]|jgi:hypothetical protein|nr:hypothetical protein [Candidatus Pacearchaeota archaeon]|tara:strand:+ start:451 stop:837 length:387 start_codon:yes stop_codon:yes gene_type:complete